MRLIFAIAALAVASPAAAKTVTIEMRNFADGKPMVFVPAYVVAEPGDTILFKATDKSHDAVTIPGMLPSGAQPAAGKLNQTLSFVVSKPGLYGIKCTPHFSMGMVALVKVGSANSNAAAAKSATAKLPPLAKAKLTALLAQAGVR